MEKERQGNKIKSQDKKEDQREGKNRKKKKSTH